MTSTSEKLEKTYFKVRSRNGFDISCVYHPCTSQENEIKNGTIILCHGLLSGKEHPLISGIAEGLKNYFSVCQLDFRGNGNSGGDTAYGNYYDEAEDVRDVVVHLETIGKNVTTILGHSKAGSVVLLYAVKYNIPQVINVSGRFDLSTMPSNRFTPAQNKLLKENGEFIWMLYGKHGKKIQTPDGIISEEIKNNNDLLDNDGEALREYVVRQIDIERRYAIDMNVIKQINPENTRILTIHGDADTIVPVENGYLHDKTLSEIKNKEGQAIHTLQILPGVSHGYRSKEEQEKLLSTVLNWIN
ncbi:alpha/beta-hydrolase [Piromyces finnis]|uniref:Alpha/beta-hydrolase n=1 Tax=Piromyces finnis TaxID=1754191 RepID=A0A1Y1VME5_9FUNG|nr:alpha/beta-hydrolase [Piromyces finnis]|eukprot:ORX60096.1 alpha/beta-hydrolase [Piromyces finnis]